MGVRDCCVWKGGVGGVWMEPEAGVRAYAHGWIEVRICFRGFVVPSSQEMFLSLCAYCC